MTASEEIQIRECTTVAEFDGCIALQKEAFGLPDQELSPRRHLIVSRQAGGWTLGAFTKDRMVGFVHHLAAVRDNEIFGYSHMMGVAVDYQNKGVGAQLKWAQRARVLAEGRDFIKWTWEPMRARNAHFNLNRLGVIVEAYAENFYGTDYGSDFAGQLQGAPGIDSDRLFASWYLCSERVTQLAQREAIAHAGPPAAAVAIPANWPQLVSDDPGMAKQEQLRVREEFKRALASGLVCAGFDRAAERPRYLFFERAR
ncbi:MAG: GCN5-related N-acetyltransferase [Acidobacteria bacterium]|nr:GCN5-related N-acetyltransferase [Acidobacteriota bacterium]